MYSVEMRRKAAFCSLCGDLEFSCSIGVTWYVKNFGRGFGSVNQWLVTFSALHAKTSDVGRGVHESPSETAALFELFVHNTPSLRTIIDPATNHYNLNSKYLQYYVIY
jgi:hypothetical protein